MLIMLFLCCLEWRSMLDNSRDGALLEALDTEISQVAVAVKQ